MRDMADPKQNAETFIGFLRRAFELNLLSEQDLKQILTASSPDRVILELKGPGSKNEQARHVFTQRLCKLLQEPIRWNTVQKVAADLLGELFEHRRRRAITHQTTEILSDCPLEKCTRSFPRLDKFATWFAARGMTVSSIPVPKNTILSSLEGADIRTARQLLAARLFETSRRTKLNWEAIAALRVAARWGLNQEAREARNSLAKNELWSKNDAFMRLSSGMALLVWRRLQAEDHSPMWAVIQMGDVLPFEAVADLTPEERLANRRDHAARTQRPLLDGLELTDESPGFLQVWLSNQFIGLFQPGQLVAAASNPSVRRISPILPVRACVDQAKVRVKGTQLFGAYSGKDQIIALIDSGIDDSHPDLCNRVIHKKHYNSGKTEDDFGHGTHLAGIAGGQCRGKYPGVAPEATLWCYRVFDSKGHSNQQDVTDAIQQVVSDAVEAIKRGEIAQGGRVVVNCSIEVQQDGFISDDDYEDFCQPFDDACSDLVVVVAAGNNGPQSGTITAPGGGSRVLTVGASSNRSSGLLDVVAPFSSRGPSRGKIPKPDIVAPGGFENPEGDAYENVSVLSSRVDNCTIDKDTSSERPWRHDPQDKEHYGLSGTSQAAALVSGLAALLLQHAVRNNCPNTHAHIADAVKRTARRLGFSSYEEGNGLVNADAAMKSL